MQAVNFFWFRRDLRLEDNAGLYHALKAGLPVVPLFIFDRNILDTLPARDARVEFIHQAILDLDSSLRDAGSSLLVLEGKPETLWPRLLEQYPAQAVYTNRDYEPYARDRDDRVAARCAERGIAFHDFKDHLIFEPGEILKDNGSPYTVFTPYKRRWLERLQSREVGRGASFYLSSYPSESYLQNLVQVQPLPIPSLEQLGFERAGIAFPPKTISQQLIRQYEQQRDFPDIEGTSRLGVHFRFGTISIREKARKALTLSATYLSELIWRDFYAQILGHFPQVAERAFKPEYEGIEWINDPTDFEAWCQGKTGYPIVDAGMRELNATGYMHNRVRMVTASFLSKHLLIDWRWGEAYFAGKLLDFDLASNNGGWQWAAGCGTDAAPYFRIFSPAAQEARFDPKRVYIRRWVPEIDSADYPLPIVEHAFARERCLAVYKRALQHR